MNLYQKAKNQFFCLFILQIQWIEYHHQTSHTPFLTIPTPEMFNHLLICMNLYQHPKNQLVPSVHSWDTINFRVQWPDCPRLFLTMPNQEYFWPTFNFCEFVSTCKKCGYFIDLFWRNSWFENLAIWLVASILA